MRPLAWPYLIANRAVAGLGAGGDLESAFRFELVVTGRREVRFALVGAAAPVVGCAAALAIPNPSSHRVATVQIVRDIVDDVHS